MESIFRDRQDAGRQLGVVLRAYAPEEPLVLALPRGGVAVGYEVARELSAPLDIWVVRKIGVPWHEELGLGAIAEDGRVHLSEEIVTSVGLCADDLAELIAAKRREVEERVRALRGDRARPAIRDHTIILVDDGIATGGTVRAALGSIRAEQPRKLVLAVPVAAPTMIRALEPLVDDVVVLATPEDLFAIGLHYDRFDQLGDDEVLRLLERARREHGEPARTNAEQVPP